MKANKNLQTTTNQSAKSTKSAKLTVVMATALALNIPQVNAAQTSAEQESYSEEIGLSSGLLLGAAVAGPVGAFVGALTGTLIGATHKQGQSLKQNELEIAQLNQELVDYDYLMTQKNSLAARLIELEDENHSLKKQNFNQQLAMSVQFRTGSAHIENHFANQLNHLAELLKASPEIHVELSGFADQRGSEESNLLLSQQRAENVKEYLVAQGVFAQQLSTQAFGDAKAVAKAQDYEGDFFDRRVTVKASNNKGGTQTARNH